MGKGLIMYVDQVGSVYQGIQTPLYSSNTNSGNSGSNIPLGTTSGPPSVNNKALIVNNTNQYKQLSGLDDDSASEALDEEHKKAEAEVNSAVYGKILNR